MTQEKAKLQKFDPKKIDPIANEPKGNLSQQKIVPKEICPKKGNLTQQKFVPKEICPNRNLSQRKFVQQKFDPKKFDPMAGEPKGKLSQQKFVPKEICPKKRKIDPREIFPKGQG